MPRIARVVVDLSLDREFDYVIPEEWRDAVELGVQVLVPFGRTRKRGFVAGLGDKSKHANLKPILEVIGHAPLITPSIMKLVRWMADYYAAPVEQVIRTVLPSAVRRKGAAFKEQTFIAATDHAKDVEALASLGKQSRRRYKIVTELLARGPGPMSLFLQDFHTTALTLKRLEQDGFTRIYLESVARNPHANKTILKTEPHVLMQEQEVAFDCIKDSIDHLKPSVVLLHGVTGSGKTEVYLQALDYALRQGKGGIILVPEISLTPQTVERFRSRFGERIAVLHSHLSTGERHDEWHRVRDGSANIVVGARSALFAPIRNLGLVVVDEEHENSYKQDESPRYNARDVAVMRGHMERCSVVLGSATPSLESFFNARRKKYALVELTRRVDDRKMPLMRIVDMRVEAEREGRVNVLSRDLAEAIHNRIERAEQTILFLNRRGFATSLVCPKCGFVVNCPQCSVAMTYHRSRQELLCHICGNRTPVPCRCPNKECGDPSIRYAGVGTEKVEDVVTRLFPHAKIARMDSDTTRRKDAYEQILGDFRAGKIDILIGTQMIAKGLHFPGVTLVGIIFADVALHMPDFRAAERTFQLLTQVAGRAGRGDVTGEVIVQTFTPFHSAVQAARRMDYEGFADMELEYRKELNYPPYSHMTCITVRGKIEEEVALAAKLFTRQLREGLSINVGLAGPTPAPLARARGLYRYQIMMRAKSVKAMVAALKPVLKTFKWPKDVACSVDIDPLNVM